MTDVEGSAAYVAIETVTGILHGRSGTFVLQHSGTMSRGEQRLSDFLLWESAYAELYFTDRLWPDFGGSDLEQAVSEFARRQRRFGGVNAATRAPLRSHRSLGGGS